MRTRNVKNKLEIINNCSYFIKSPNKWLGKWQKLFKNDNPIYLEIGMGKGKFLFEMAKIFPNINFIGMEKSDSVICKAIKNHDPLPNLFLLCEDAKNIDIIFKEEISLLYLNFSDPWPKKRHSKRRLTDEFFLSKYDSIFKNGCQLKIKTDNNQLFENSVLSLLKCNYKIKDISLDLHSKDQFNIKTEYEEKFKDNKIKYIEAIK